MARYFFDVSNGETTLDDTGIDLGSREQIEHEAARILADIAKNEMPPERSLSVVVKDSGGTAVYFATLSLQGRWNGTQ